MAQRDAASGSHVVVAPERGALARSFVVGGQELLYLDEATIADPERNVRGDIPVLFPSLGKLHEDRWQRDGRSVVMSSMALRAMQPGRSQARPQRRRRELISYWSPMRSCSSNFLGNFASNWNLR